METGLEHLKVSSFVVFSFRISISEYFFKWRKVIKQKAYCCVLANWVDLIPIYIEYIDVGFFSSDTWWEFMTQLASGPNLSDACLLTQWFSSSVCIRTAWKLGYTVELSAPPPRFLLLGLGQSSEFAFPRWGWCCSCNLKCYFSVLFFSPA